MCDKQLIMGSDCKNDSSKPFRKYQVVRSLVCKTYTSEECF